MAELSDTTWSSGLPLQGAWGPCCGLGPSITDAMVQGERKDSPGLLVF